MSRTYDKEKIDRRISFNNKKIIKQYEEMIQSTYNAYIQKPKEYQLRTLMRLSLDLGRCMEREIIYNTRELGK